MRDACRNSESDACRNEYKRHNLKYAVNTNICNIIKMRLH